MDIIPSFLIDHNKLLRGIYVSRQDSIGVETITTFDVRMKEPNREPVIGSAAMHTIEHLGATFLRNEDAYKDELIYFGPMGCFTGVYILMKGDLESKDIAKMVTEMFEFVVSFEGEIPGNMAKDCGNHLDHNMAMAKYEAKKYLEDVLYQLKDENLSYPE